MQRRLLFVVLVAAPIVMLPPRVIAFTSGPITVVRRHASKGISRCLRQRPLLRRRLSAFPADDDVISETKHNSTLEHKRQQLHDAETLSLAPMMEYTNRHFRHLVRLISSNTLLYTEMVAANAITHERESLGEQYLALNPGANREEVSGGYDPGYLRRYLAQGRITPLEGPSVLQLGGSDPEQLFTAAQTVMELTKRGGVCDYTALNLNCGCPSPKVAGKGCFGAALMDNPKVVRELTEAMFEGAGGEMPVTVKCRIGTDSSMERFNIGNYAELDAEEEYARLCNFIETVASGGVVTDFQVHARIAVLGRSFSPADNRKVPPLKYDFVRRLVTDYPELSFSLNGGIETLSQAKAELDSCDGLKGVMVGRAWTANPWSFALADDILYPSTSTATSSSAPAHQRALNRLEILNSYGCHADFEERHGDPLKIRRFIIQAVGGLFAGEPNGKKYRIALDEIAGLPKKLMREGKSLDSQPPLSELILNAAVENIREDVLLRTREESYERIVWDEERRKSCNQGRSEISKREESDPIPLATTA